MDIESKAEGEAQIVSLKGRLDAVEAPGCQKALEGFINDGAKILVINLEGLDYISSAGLRTLLFAAKKIKPTGGVLLFSHLHGTVQEVFELSGFTSVFQIFGTDEEAMKSLQ